MNCNFQLRSLYEPGRSTPVSFSSLPISCWYLSLTELIGKLGQGAPRVILQENMGVGKEKQKMPGSVLCGDLLALCLAIGCEEKY